MSGFRMKALTQKLTLHATVRGTIQAFPSSSTHSTGSGECSYRPDTTRKVNSSGRDHRGMPTIGCQKILETWRTKNTCQPRYHGRGTGRGTSP